MAEVLLVKSTAALISISSTCTLALPLCKTSGDISSGIPMADGNKLLPPARLTASGLPVLHPGEIVSILVSSVDLLFEENPNFPHLKSGILNLTNHRLLWLPHSTPGEPIYIPLATISHIFSLKKSMFSSPRIRFQVSVSSDGRVDRRGVSSVVVTLILRDKKSDPEVFLGKFWEALKGKDWEESESVEGKDRAMSSSGQSSGSTGGEGSLAVRTPMVGVSGILRKEQEMWESTDKSLQDAFQDLNALMSKAKEMVMLAEKMRSKLLSGSSTQAGGTTEDELGTKEEMQDWLLSVGIASPVTKESAGALYHQQLSRQLADYVKNKLEKAGGTLNLIDVYCMFNRARGTELISPDDLLQACSLWEKLDVPVMLRKFDSGVRVIQNKTHSDDEVFSRIRSLVTKPDALGSGISASDAAMALGVAPAMAKEYLLTAESKGLLCRDISPDGFRFFINMFPEINIDNLYLVRDYSFYAAWINTLSTSR